MKTRKTKASVQKALQHFLDNPGAKPTAVAARFKISTAYAYRLRDKARGKERSSGELVSQAELDALTASLQPTPESLAAPESLEMTLGSRATAYGAFADNARLAQALKRTLADHAQDMGTLFADDQWEALEMITTKISRIVNGNPNDIDQWHDIAGYATLVADRLRGVIR